VTASVAGTVQKWTAQVLVTRARSKVFCWGAEDWAQLLASASLVLRSAGGATAQRVPAALSTATDAQRQDGSQQPCALHSPPG
jgi:hypothetical protein